MSTTRDHGLCLATLVLMAMIVGCSGRSRTTTGDGQTYIPAKPVTAQALMPLEAGEATYVHKQAGQEKQVTFELAPADGDTWTWMARDLRTTVLRADGDGGIGIEHDIDWGEDADARYTPTLMLLPAKLASDEPFIAESSMTVYDAKGRTIKAKGTCKVTIELLGKRSVDTPAGPIECHVVRTVRQIDLDMAKVQVTIHSAYALGKGLVRQTVERHTMALGIFGNKASEELVLLK